MDGAVNLVKVAVDGATLSFDKLYAYVWNDAWGEPMPGIRVLVPFGNGNRKIQGIVLEVSRGIIGAGYKKVIAKIDEAPLLNEELCRLMVFMRERTFCSYFDAFRTMIPTGLSMQIKKVLRPAPDVSPDKLDALTPNEKRLLNAVAKSPNGIEQETLLKRLGMTDGSPALEHLVSQGVLLQSEDSFRRVKDATIRFVRLAGDAGDDLSRDISLTDKQRSVLHLITDAGAVSVKEVCYFTGVTQAVIQALEKKGLVLTYDAPAPRSPIAETGKVEPPVALNEEQSSAYRVLADLYEQHEPKGALLYGVTGSGKTAVYMQLIDTVLADGKQVIVLVPEISLTPQTVNLFSRRFGKKVAILHSSLSLGERADEWKRIKNGEASIVVGTRSAVFAPVSDLGLIIMDEEQEHTYKSENSPRYHARDVARFRCGYHRCLLLQVSATPSLESYYATQTGRTVLVKLPNRFGSVGLPDVDVVDMRTEEVSDDGIIGPTLENAMHQCLDDGKQVILLLNRRGFHTHISCRSCSTVLQCPSCSISMTYHRANNRLMCHYCGHSQPVPTVCPVCQSDKLRFSGLGTQKVEEELCEKFPHDPVLRMDTDTTMSRYAYEEKFSAFARGEYSIMIGTQMVAKGLDFPKVGLVGVLSADQSLYAEDFRCYETAFSLLTQVIGRAGRRDETGKAVIQTFTPDNPVISLASRQDYPSFYEMEIASRRMMHYPPFADLYYLGFAGEREETVKKAVYWCLETLHRLSTTEYVSLPVIALDPTPAGVSKVAGKFRYKLLIKTQNTSVARKMFGELSEQYRKQNAYRDVSLYIDVNPTTVW